MLGQLITNLLLPGIPLAYYGEEQDLYLLDSQGKSGSTSASTCVSIEISSETHLNSFQQPTIIIMAVKR